jgi:hypothetical protein
MILPINNITMLTSSLISYLPYLYDVYSGVNSQLLNRLKLSDGKIESLIQGITMLANKEDPIHKVY